jgi:hypothetical protein
VPPRRHRLLAVALAAAAAAPPAYAQTAVLNAEPGAPAAPVAFPPAPLAQAPAAASAFAGRGAAPAPGAGPAIGAASVGLQPARQADASVAQEEAALQARARNNFSQSQVLMIVGGAALLTGLIIGDDAGTVLAVGGAGVGLYGLYRYLQGR